MQGVFGLAAALAGLGALGVLIYQVHHWLREAYWLQIPIPFERPYGDWQGVNVILDLLWAVHPSVYLVLIAFFFSLQAAKEEEREYDRRRAAENGRSQT
jgi:uncharacterized membrane protein